MATQPVPYEQTAQPVPPSRTVPAPRAVPAVHAGGSAEDDARLVRHIVIAAAICIPVFVCVWVGLVALAVTIAGVGYAAPLLMAIAIGVLAGIFFGAWIGFVLFSREVD